MATSVIKRNAADYTNSQLLKNNWTETNGDCYAYRKGDVVTLKLNIGINQGITIQGFNNITIRSLPEWAVSSYEEEVGKTVIFPNGVIAYIRINKAAQSSLMMLPYSNLTAGYNLYTSFTYVV